MADSPLKRLARLLGGVALTQGRIPHQILGQLLITNATSVEIAGANVVVAATSRQRNAVAQVALRTAAPALAVQGLVSRQEKRLQRLVSHAEERSRKAGATLERAQTERRQHDQRMLELQRAQARLDARSCRVDEQAQQLETREREAEEQAARLDARALALEARATELEQQAARLRQAEAELQERERRLARSTDAPHACEVPGTSDAPSMGEAPSSFDVPPTDDAPATADAPLASSDTSVEPVAIASSARRPARSSKKTPRSKQKRGLRSSRRDPFSDGEGEG